MPNLHKAIKTPNDFYTEVRKGNVSGHSVVAIVARNSAVGTSFETLWGEGGMYSFPSSASQMTVSSADADDTSAGTGLRTLLLTYLDASYIEQTEVITMNGQTAVNTVATDILRIQSMVGLTAGSSGSNEGLVYIGTGTVTTGKPANVFGIISMNGTGGDNFSMHGFYTIPDGKTGFLLSVLQSIDGNKDATTKIMIKQETGLLINSGQITDTGGANQFIVSATPGYIAHTDISFDSRLTSGSAELNIFAELLLVDD